MNNDQIILATEAFVKRCMADYDSGHDWWHIDRVRRIARYINSQELLADPFKLEIAVLLHDTVDSKFRKDDQEPGYRVLEDFMTNTGLISIKDQVIEVVRNVSFSNKKPAGNLSDPVLLILQDADRIDAIGAIGVARAFNYGGFRNNPIYDPVEKEEEAIPSTVGHFYDKLLKLKDMMNTSTGRRLAEEKHEFLELFLKQFYKEWEFETATKSK